MPCSRIRPIVPELWVLPRIRPRLGGHYLVGAHRADVRAPPPHLQAQGMAETSRLLCFSRQQYTDVWTAQTSVNLHHL